MSEDVSVDESKVEPDALISEMRGRIEDLRAQLDAERQAHAEARRIIAGLVERIPPQLEPPREAPESAESRGSSDTPTDSDGGAQRASERPRDTAEFPVGGSLIRPWWRRILR